MAAGFSRAHTKPLNVPWKRVLKSVRTSVHASPIEFAFILPFMLLLYIGSVELGEGYQVQYQVTDTARTVTDLASQYISLNASTMSSILNASSTIISPYSNSNLTVTVSQVKVNTGATNGTVYQWSCSLHGTKRSIGSTVTLPTNLQAPTSTIYLIYGEVSYPFTPHSVAESAARSI